MILALLAFGTTLTMGTPTPSPPPCRSAAILIQSTSKSAASPSPQATCLSTDLKLKPDTSSRTPSELQIVAASPSPIIMTTPPSAATCVMPFRDAEPIHAVTPDYPDTARKRNLGQAHVMVLVTLSPKGAVMSARVQHSSGDLSIDMAALDAARKTTYAPKIVDCKPITGTYLFFADFKAG